MGPVDSDPQARRAAVDGIASMLALVKPAWSSDPQLEDTPARVVRAFEEMTAGYSMSPAEILTRQFPARYDGLVSVRGVRFSSICAHHLMPFTGTAVVGYLPSLDDGTVVGLSKMARLVECFARRLQLQETMTQDIATSLKTHLHCRGAGCIVEAHHACMGCRGVRQQDAVMVTSSLLGDMRQEPLRSEFLALRA